MNDINVEYRSVIKLRYRTLWSVCLVFLLLLLILNVSSYFTYISSGFALFFLPTFVFFGLGIIDFNSKNEYWGKKRPLKPLIKVHINPLTVILLIAIVIYYFISFTNLFSYNGVPNIIDGKYVLNNHGSYTYINYELYINACMTEARVTSAGLMLFMYISFAYFFSKKTRLDKNNATS